MAASASIASMFQLQEQTALVTGGTRGIDQAMIFALAEAGADIILRDPTADTTKHAVEKLGRTASIHEADLSSSAFVTALVPAILKDGHKIDILLNCAGVQRRHPSHQFPLEDWNEVYTSRDYHLKHTHSKQVLQVNQTTVFTLCRDVGAHMLEHKPSPAGRRAQLSTWYLYYISKAG
ncbi:hypothetical protein OEA41_007385 [Lepraria neglecta]|uniref:Uncharacterized protein n=1 Tax=Lepraria neglecta TaxID=209136 RepID=A0AAD9ZDK7_9LECA|nr:hypothetical protein OEA41_007385 [Lepraria neglecta]